MKSVWRAGEPFVWLTGAALAVALVMVAGLVFLVVANAAGFFWPHQVARLTLDDGSVVVGEVTEREAIPDPDNPSAKKRYRIQLKQGNRDLYGADFVWVDEDRITRREMPPELAVFERREWGNLYGIITELREAGHTIAGGTGTPMQALRERLPETNRVVDRIRSLEQKDIGEINHAQEKIRLRQPAREIAGRGDDAEAARLRQQNDALQEKYSRVANEVTLLRAGLNASVVVSVAGGKEKDLPLAQIVRVYQPNAMGLLGKVGFYFAKLWELVSTDPRESNTEGGLLPAIFGTVMMVLIMSLLVTPLGVIAAFYLREYAKQGPFVSAVRIAVNNLAGVPSIVFGVFGVGFFIYFIGGSIDRFFFSESLPTPTFGTGGILWASLTLALLTVPVVIVATEEGLAAIPGGVREASAALGATKFETTRRVVLPAVMPSILTGLILAMARAAGEVAPLMITGVVKLAPSLPVDGFSPFVHLDRKFMHLGFHIYDVGFQSPNVDAARPMVYVTTLVLLLIVLLLNLVAITLRTRLRRKFAGAAM